MSAITAFLTHKQGVTRLYKAAIREIRNRNNMSMDLWRYEATLIRDRFEKNRNISDLRVARQKLLEGEQELQSQMNPNPLKFAYSPGGISYDRDAPYSDNVLDQWHPLEKAQYPDYFSKRVELKKEYITWYVRKYGIDSYNSEVEGHISAHGDDHHGHH